MSTPIDETPERINAAELDPHATQLTMLLLYCLELLGGKVSLPPINKLTDYIAGKGVKLVRNTDGTATLTLTQEDPDAN